MVKEINSIDQIPDSVPVYDKGLHSGRAVKCVLVIREGDVALSSLETGEYGFFGDLNAVNARIFWAMTLRITNDKAWFQEHINWVVQHAEQIDRHFRRDALASKIKESKNLN